MYKAHNRFDKTCDQVRDLPINIEAWVADPSGSFFAAFTVYENAVYCAKMLNRGIKLAQSINRLIKDTEGLT